MCRRAVLLVAALGILGAVRSPAQERAGIDQLAWLQGCWALESSQRTVEETWMAPRGGAMLGMSRTVRGDTMTQYELVVLREENGSLEYQAHPSGQPSAVFALKQVTATSVLFENLQHDFPQRVGYRPQPPGSLRAWIEGTLNGKARRVEFQYRKVECPGGQ